MRLFAKCEDPSIKVTIKSHVKRERRKAEIARGSPKGKKREGKENLTGKRMESGGRLYDPRQKVSC